MGAALPIQPQRLVAQRRPLQLRVRGGELVAQECVHHSGRGHNEIRQHHVEQLLPQETAVAEAVWALQVLEQIARDEDEEHGPVLEQVEQERGQLDVLAPLEYGHGVSRNDDEDGEGAESVDVDEERARIRPGIRYRPARGGVGLTLPWRRRRQSRRREGSRFFRHNRVPPSRRKPVRLLASLRAPNADPSSDTRAAFAIVAHRRQKASIMPLGLPASALEMFAVTVGYSRQRCSCCAAGDQD